MGDHLFVEKMGRTPHPRKIGDEGTLIRYKNGILCTIFYLVTLKHPFSEGYSINPASLLFGCRWW
jgi:hypothetical protein